MHAIRLHAFGPAENLRYEEVDDPEPGAGQVRIAVSAAGVHLIDTSLRAGQQMGPLPLPDLPAIPGREVAGTVDGLGQGVAPSWLGARVWPTSARQAAATPPGRFATSSGSMSSPRALPTRPR